MCSLNFCQKVEPELVLGFTSDEPLNHKLPSSTLACCHLSPTMLTEGLLDKWTWELSPQCLIPQHHCPCKWASTLSCLQQRDIILSLFLVFLVITNSHANKCQSNRFQYFSLEEQEVNSVLSPKIVLLVVEEIMRAKIFLFFDKSWWLRVKRWKRKWESHLRNKTLNDQRWDNLSIKITNNKLKVT